MPTVINNPGSSESSGMGTGLVLGIIVAVIIVAALVFMYGLPALQGQPQDNTSDINVELPNLNNNPSGSPEAPQQ